MVLVCAEAFAKTVVVNGWESGRPVTLEGLEAELREKFPEGELQAAKPYPPDDFFTSYFGSDPGCSRKYRNWRKDFLDRIGYSSLKKTVSQTIPNDWWSNTYIALHTREPGGAGAEYKCLLRSTFVQK